MTPLCGAVFSRENIKDISTELGMGEVSVIAMLNQSTTSGGQYLPFSSLACSVVATIAATKKVTDKNVRSMMVTRLIKQYSHKGKVYDPKQFSVLAKYASGGVPVGMDADTLIETFNNVQVSEVNMRTRNLALKQSEILPMPRQNSVSSFETSSPPVVRSAPPLLPRSTPQDPAPGTSYDDAYENQDQAVQFKDADDFGKRK